MFIPRHNMT